jgi:hypothetical protein
MSSHFTFEMKTVVIFTRDCAIKLRFLASTKVYHQFGQPSNGTTVCVLAASPSVSLPSQR